LQQASSRRPLLSGFLPISLVWARRCTKRAPQRSHRSLGPWDLKIVSGGLIGQTLSHFRITAKLGEGGMGEVYVAEDTHLKRNVALRVLPRELAESPERLRRFQSEAASLAALNHPNIVHVYSVEVDRVGDSEVHFLTMELVEGESLDQVVGDERLPLERVLDLAIPLADALAEAHERGIVHRDLKPANIVVDGRGTSKILDLGLAKLRLLHTDIDFEDPASTAGNLDDADLDSLACMSPEQVEGEPTDHRGDLFSFGAILYEMLTGRRAFAGTSSPALAGGIVRDSPPPMNSSRQDLPRALQTLVEGCLEKNPEARIQSAAEVRDALLEVRAGIAPTYRRPLSVWLRDELLCTPARRALVGALAVAILAGAAIWIRGMVNTDGSALPPRAGSTPSAAASSPETPSPAAGALGRGDRLAGRYSFFEQPEAFGLALAEYQEALGLDSDNAAVPAEIARLYTQGMMKGAGISSLMPEAERWSARAVELDPGSNLVSTMLWDLERTRAQPHHREILEAEVRSRERFGIAVDPYTLAFYSFILGDEAYRHALEVDPNYHWGFINRAVILVALGRGEEALGLIDEVLLLEPGSPAAQRTKARILIRLGRFDEARDVIGASASELPAPQAEMRQIELEMALEIGEPGRVAESLPIQQTELLDTELPFTIRWRYRAPALIESLARNGYAEEALDLMSQMHEAGLGEPPYDWLHLSPLFDPMRDDPRFEAVEAQARENFTLMLEYLDRDHEDKPLPTEIEQVRLRLIEQLGG